MKKIKTDLIYNLVYNKDMSFSENTNNKKAKTKEELIKDFEHHPVMLDTCMRYLEIKTNDIVVDCTTGGGGHSCAILSRLGNDGKLFCFDKDEVARAVAEAKLLACQAQILESSGQTPGFEIVAKDFREAGEFFSEQRQVKVDKLLADLGVSSHQLDEAGRGFAYMKDGPLDMRMDLSQSYKASDFIAEAGYEELKTCFYKYGEEKYSALIAKNIIKRKEAGEKFETSFQLVDAIIKSLPAKAKREKQHPAKRVFQAIRIHVNSELQALEKLLAAIPSIVKPGARICFIAFHSLEDSLIKEAMNRWQNPCTCPRHLPFCSCGQKSLGRQIAKGIKADDRELEINSRSRSATVRVFEFNR